MSNCKRKLFRVVTGSYQVYQGTLSECKRKLNSLLKHNPSIYWIEYCTNAVPGVPTWGYNWQPYNEKMIEKIG